MKIFLSIIIGSFITGLGILFLLYEKLSGAESVILILGGVIIGLIIYFSSEVQEFSIAGNAVRLKELKGEALKAIDDLKQARTEIFRLMLPQTLNFDGVWGNGSKVDERVESFIRLYKKITEFDCVDELNQDIQKVLCVLIRSQYNNLFFIHQSEQRIPKDNLDNLWQPQDLYIQLKDQMIENICSQTSPHPDFFEIKKDVMSALDTYKELYLIYKKLQP